MNREVLKAIDVQRRNDLSAGVKLTTKSNHDRSRIRIPARRPARHVFFFPAPCSFQDALQYGIVAEQI